MIAFPDRQPLTHVKEVCPYAVGSTVAGCISLAGAYPVGLLPVSDVHSANVSHSEAHCCYICICSTEPRERLGGVLAIDELIDVKVSYASLLLRCCTAKADT